MSGLLNIGLTGLGAAQAHLLTTGHNITNAAVAGYHRQSVIQTTNHPHFAGVGFLGQGTQITAIKRAYNEYLETQVMGSSARLSELEGYESHIRLINNLLGDATSGLSPALEGFFAGVQEMASNPTSVAARQSVISAGQAMSERFKAMDGRIDEVRQGVETEIKSMVGEVNMYARSIAEMNQRITLAQVGGPTVAANDLLDQRDQMVAELNKLLKVSTVIENNGAMSVFVGSGQGLVVGNTHTELGAVRDPLDPQRTAVALVSQRGVENILPEHLLSGGALGGVLAFRRESLDVAQNALGLIALGVAETFNEQHRKGVDLDGMLGTDFFRSPVPTLKPDIIGASVEIDDVAQLTADDFVLREESGVYTLKGRTGASFTVTAGTHPVTGDPALIGAGMIISLPPGTVLPPQGLLIQPTRFASRDITVGISDPRKMAAGDPVGGAMSVGPGDKALTDFMTGIRTLNVNGIDGNSDGRADFAGIDINFDSAGDTLTASSGSLFRFDVASKSWVAGGAYDPDVDSSGVTYRWLSNAGDDPADPQAFAVEFKAHGAWTDEHNIRFSPTEAGVADSRNAVALGALQTSKVMLDTATGERSATFQASYASMVTQIGNKTREVQVNILAQEALLVQATDARDSLAGVNLDEEAANLVRYQMAYQSSAKVMTVAQTLFDSVLSIAR